MPASTLASIVASIVASMLVLAPSSSRAADPSADAVGSLAPPPIRARLGVAPGEIGARSVVGADGFETGGSGTYGLDGQLLFAVGDVVELGAGGAWDHTGDGGFDALRTFATARFHARVGKGAEIGIAPRLGYAWAWADSISPSSKPIYRRSFVGENVSLALDGRMWINRHVALFAEIEARYLNADATSTDMTQGYYANPTFRVLAFAPTLGVVAAF